LTLLFWALFPVRQKEELTEIDGIDAETAAVIIEQAKKQMESMDSV